MSHTATFIGQLVNNRRFDPDGRARLRTLAGQGLDKDTSGFDLFTALWWPLRRQSAGAPRRETCWLVSKLYAAVPVPHVRQNCAFLPMILGQCEPPEQSRRERYRQRFDALLQAPLSGLEPHLRWALSVIADAVEKRKCSGVDWVRLLDDLSIWDRGEEHRRGIDIHEEWAEQYLKALK